MTTNRGGESELDLSWQITGLTRQKPLVLRGLGQGDAWPASDFALREALRVGIYRLRMKPRLKRKMGSSEFRELSSLHRSGEQTARASHVEPDSDRRAYQSHDNAIAVGAAKYCSHDPAVDPRLADHGDETAAAARDLGSCHVECEEFTQKPGGSVSVERKVGFFLVIHGDTL
jgi:hypothetical protein